MVGDQNGGFSPHGWHVTGEMGGIWDHPIKLMDGFGATVQEGEASACLNQADQFLNYPFANLHIFNAPLPDLRVDRFQFVPDGQEAVVVRFTFQNKADNARELAFTFNAFVDLRPVWLGEKTRMYDTQDDITWDETAQSWIGKDSLNNWFVAWSADTLPTGKRLGSPSCEFEHGGLGRNAASTYRISLPPNGSRDLTIVIAGSAKSQFAATQTMETVKNQALILLAQKKVRYLNLNDRARLTIPDPELQQVYEWVKYNTDWLVRDVPGVGRGLSAGMADYPWWFGCDNTYALQGVLATGRPQLAISTLQLLKDISERVGDSGRVVHEISTNGAVFNKGNLNETPHFTSMIWSLYEWTGNDSLLQVYYPFIQKGLEWVLAQNDEDGDYLPEGAGMMEIPGLESELPDVAVYTQQAFQDAARMAHILGDKVSEAKYQEIASSLLTKIQEEFWVEKFESYGDFIATTREALELIDAAIMRADTLDKPWAVAELKATRNVVRRYPLSREKGFVVYHNWVVNTPLEKALVDTTEALLALNTGRKFTNEFGVYVTGIDRDESAGVDEAIAASRSKAFSYVGAVMTLPTGIQAIAENHYGRPDKALDYLKRMARSFSYALPGSMYEVSPDYGMMTQAWTIYGLAYPIVRQFFGIHPAAYRRTVTIKPQMPSRWLNASLDNLRIGDNQLTMKYRRTGETQVVTLVQERASDTLIVAYPKDTFTRWELDGNVLEPLSDEIYDYIKMTGGSRQVIVRP